MAGQTQTDRKIRVSFSGLRAGELPHVTVAFPDSRGTVTLAINDANQQAYEALVATVCAEAGI